MKLSIVLSTHAAQFEAVAFKGDFAGNVAKIAEWGYDGVELAVRDPTLVDADELERVVSSYGLEVPAIGTGQAWGEEGLSFTSDDPNVRAAAIERIKSHIPLAARLDAVVILGLIRGITPEGQTHEQSMAYLTKALQACSEAALAEGVRYALEPLNRYETDLIHTVDEGLALIEDVGFQNFGLLLDTFHMNIEEPSIEESIRACGDRIFHFHVADSNRWYPGAGHLDFPSILETLYATGYDGHVSGEFMPVPDADTSAQRSIRHLRQIAPQERRSRRFLGITQSHGGTFMARSWHLPPDRYLDPHPALRRVAMELYETVADLPIISPHGHVDPRLFADESEDASFGTPAELLIIPDHYVFRMLYSQGIPLESLGIAPLPVRERAGLKVETDHRKIWQIFGENFYLFRGTPTGIWLTQVLIEMLGVEEKLTGETAQAIYDQIAQKLASPEFRPRALFERFNIEVLCTTDFASDTLEHHRAIQASDWSGDVRPTFRPDDVIHLLRPGWRDNVDALSDLTGIAVDSYTALIRALEERRAFFKELGAVATDSDGTVLATGELSPREADEIFQRALKGQATTQDAARFFGHMLMESARMSIEDGLVMQVHFGSYRNHNQPLFDRLGPDMGSDIPFRAEFTRNLRPLLNKYGNDPRLTFIVFTLDESAYSRELAPLAGHYPAMKLGPPWWFHDSLNGMRRYFERVMETAGLYNTVGFNDDTRAFPSIPVRHDVWRRASANWIAGLVVRGIVDEEDARKMILDLAYRLARRAYKFDEDE